MADNDQPPRPVGNAGRGKHTGKVGPLGGKHRDNSGCLGAFVLIIAGVATAVGTVGYYGYQVLALVANG